MTGKNFAISQPFETVIKQKSNYEILVFEYGVINKISQPYSGYFDVVTIFQKFC